MKRVIVIGGGASGMIAAGAASQKGYKVQLLEKNEKLGKKLYITGKGRCNLTNASDAENILQNIIGNPYFMYSALYNKDSFAVMEFFESLGLRLKTERGTRVFPLSDKSSDVIKVLDMFLKENSVKVKLNTEVKELKKLEKDNFEIKDSMNNIYICDRVIICTGGISYPLTGSTGDGYIFAKKMGHKIITPTPSLTSLTCKENYIKELAGLSLKNVKVKVTIKNKSVYEAFGEMLFTHSGVSGPIILSASRILIGKYDLKPILNIDLKPALSNKDLDNRILKDFEKYKNKDFKNSLDDLLPQKLIPVVIKVSGINPEKKINEVTKEERKTLLETLKKLSFEITGGGNFAEAVVTCGGVSVDEIDPSTMESKLVKGLYFAGEVLDVDALTGGYNLQIAFSTGFLAGESV